MAAREHRENGLEEAMALGVEQDADPQQRPRTIPAKTSLVEQRDQHERSRSGVGLVQQAATILQQAAKMAQDAMALAQQAAELARLARQTHGLATQAARASNKRGQSPTSGLAVRSGSDISLAAQNATGRDSTDHQQRRKKRVWESVETDDVEWNRREKRRWRDAPVASVPTPRATSWSGQAQAQAQQDHSVVPEQAQDRGERKGKTVQVQVHTHADAEKDVGKAAKKS